MLQQAFVQIMGEYSQDTTLIDELWIDIKRQHSGKKRYYHNLTHLENLLIELTAHKKTITNWPAVVLAICYHDVVYNVLKHDNEEKSAAYAHEKLAIANVPEPVIMQCDNIIIATKNHSFSLDEDTNLFTDADLSILGKSWEVYEVYYQQVRKEYNVYPDIVYNPGRQKVLQHFLQMERIFKTEPFFTAYEAQARQNLAREMEVL